MCLFVAENLLVAGVDKETLNLYYGGTLSKLGGIQQGILGGEIAMTIVRYDPFRDLRTLQEEVNRLFSTNLTRAFDDEGIGRGAWAPSVDIYENKDLIVLEAELPGMKQDEFDLSIENNVITLRGERKFEKTYETDNYHRVER